MEYSFSRRNMGNSKEIIHFYELGLKKTISFSLKKKKKGGEKMLSDLITIPLTEETINNFVYVIVLDCSKPS